MRIAIDARLWAEPRSGIGRYTRALTEHLLRLAPEERWILYVDRPPGPALPGRRGPVPAVAPAARLVPLARAAGSPPPPGRRLPRRHGVRAARARPVDARDHGPRSGAAPLPRPRARPPPLGRARAPGRRAPARSPRDRRLGGDAERGPGPLSAAARRASSSCPRRPRPHFVPAVRARAGGRARALRPDPPVRPLRGLPRAEEEPRGPPRRRRRGSAAAARGARPSSSSSARPAGARPPRRARKPSGSRARCASSAPRPDADLPALYGGALAFVFPSLWEGFGLPVLEAMASGAPVVASNRGALPEVTGGAALLVDPAPAPLADALERLLADPALRERLRAAGLARARPRSRGSAPRARPSRSTGRPRHDRRARQRRARRAQRGPEGPGPGDAVRVPRPRHRHRARPRPRRVRQVHLRVRARHASSGSCSTSASRSS